MTIKFFDGSTLECHKIEFSGRYLYVDEYRVVYIEDVESIED